MKILTAYLAMFVLLSATVATNLGSPHTNVRDTPVAVGEVAPDFTLEDQNKHKVALAYARGKSPVVLVFYRGYW